MKIRSLIFYWTVSVILSGMVGVADGRQAENASNQLAIAITTGKKSFQLGEIVPTNVTIKNNSKNVIHTSVDPCISISTRRDDDFKLYVPEGRLFTVDGADVTNTLKPQETLRIQQSILWNSKPQVSHLNADAAKPSLEGRILSDYAFTAAGIYFIKACVGIVENGRWKIVESEPIQILVEQPTGDELEVWNRIRGNGEIAYFMQEGNLTRGYKKPEELAKFRQEIEEILNSYPCSLYAEPLRQGLFKLNARDAKR